MARHTAADVAEDLTGLPLELPLVEDKVKCKKSVVLVPFHDENKATKMLSKHWRKSRVVGFVLLVLLVHVAGSSYFAPHMVSRIEEESTDPISLFSTSSYADSNHGEKPKRHQTGTSAGLVSRLLSETANTLHLHHLVESSNSQAALVGDDIEKVLRVRDGLKNPLQHVPKSMSESIAEDHLRVHTAPPLVQLHKEKCTNTQPIIETVISSRLWVKRFGGNVTRYRWCRGGKSTEVPDLERVLILRSKKQLPPRAVTIVTQLSLERLDMLEQQCAHWPHPIAAVVYIPLVQGKISSTEDESWNGTSLEIGIDEVKQTVERIQNSRCILDLELVVEERCTFEQATLYPTNAVRNRALVMTRSDIVLLLDVDFVVDLSLAFDLENENRHSELTDLLASGVAVVLPAFEAWDQGERGKKIALTAVKEGKKYIAQKFMYNVVMGFHMAHYPQGHEPTLFWKWINTTEPYQVQHEVGFEPYILMLKEHVPYYDERFRGYYFNKVEHLLHISTQFGLPFVVHPSSFVVHVPHPKAKTKWRTKRSGQKERNHAMFLDAMEDIKQNRFAPVTSFPHLCLPAAIQLELADIIEHSKQSQGAEEQVMMLRRYAERVRIDS